MHGLLLGIAGVSERYRIGRPPSFTNIVRRLNDGCGTPHHDSTIEAYLLKTLDDDHAFAPPPHAANIRALVRKFLSRKMAPLIFKATTAINLLINGARCKNTRRDG
jgi:hypothetical protein